MMILSKFSIVIWLSAYVFPCMFRWTYILKKYGEIRCVLGSKFEQYCTTFPANIKHEHCCEHCRILEEIAEKS